MNNDNTLLNLRRQIITVDEKILKLLYARKELVINIAKEKIKIKKPIRDIERERDLIKHINDLCKIYKLDIDYINLIFQCIINHSVIIQNKILKDNINNKNNKKEKIAFLGPTGSYSDIVSQKYIEKYLKKAIKISCSNFQKVVNLVETDQADIAILPIENSNSGTINDVYDLLKNTNLSIIGELLLPINHCLLTKNQNDLEKIKKVYSHPQSFQQCSNFIKNFEKWKLEYTDSTAAAMQIVSSMEDTSIAALGNENSGKLYNLKVIKKNIANYKKNITRFVVLANMPIFVSQNIPSKTTLIISINQQSGSLVEALVVFRENNINISKLVSRPISENPWEEMFYIDIKSNLFSKEMQKSLNKLYVITKSIKILGCYPIDNIYDVKAN